MFQTWWTQINTHPDLTARILAAVTIALLTVFVSTLIAGTVKRASRRFIHHEAARTLPEFLGQVVRWLILVIGLVAVLNKLGVQTTSLVAVLGAASLAIGLALQGTLGNVAASLVILFTKPFQIGDVVRLGEVIGRVHRLGLFTTEINDSENRRVFVPNSKVFSSEIINHSLNGAVRVEVFVDVAYESDLEQVLKLLGSVVEGQPGLVSQNAPFAGLHEFRDSGISVRLLMWVAPSQAMAARSALMVAVKKALDAHNIDIPYPHQVTVGWENVAPVNAPPPLASESPPSP